MMLRVRVHTLRIAARQSSRYCRDWIYATVSLDPSHGCRKHLWREEILTYAATRTKTNNCTAIRNPSRAVGSVSGLPTLIVFLQLLAKSCVIFSAVGSDESPVFALLDDIIASV